MELVTSRCRALQVIRIATGTRALTTSSSSEDKEIEKVGCMALVRINEKVIAKSCKGVRKSLKSENQDMQVTLNVVVTDHPECGTYVGQFGWEMSARHLRVFLKCVSKFPCNKHASDRAQCLFPHKITIKVPQQ